MNHTFGSKWQIPKNWDVISLKEITSEWRGGAPFKPKDFTEKGFPVLHKGAIQKEGIISVDPKKKTFTTAKYAEDHQKSVIDQSYMAVTLRDLVPSAPSIGLIANVAHSSSCKYILAQGAYGFKIDSDRVNSSYLVWLSNYEPFRKHMKRYAVGSTQVHIRTPVFQDINIPLPPLEEQKRIAAILDKADAIRRKRKEAIALTEELLRSTFLDMFGDPVTNPKGWETDLFGRVGILNRGKSKHRPRNDPSLLNGKYPLIQTGDVANCKGVIETYTQTYSEKGLAQSKMWNKGTLCITIAANIAKTGVLGFDACFPDSVVGFQPNERTTNEYIQGWLQFLQPILEDRAPQSAQKNINLEILRNLDLPVPPIKAQQKFSTVIEQIRKHSNEQEKDQILLNNLFNSLLQKAFRGEL